MSHPAIKKRGGDPEVKSRHLDEPGRRGGAKAGAGLGGIDGGV